MGPSSDGGRARRRTRHRGVAGHAARSLQSRSRPWCRTWRTRGSCSRAWRSNSSAVSTKRSTGHGSGRRARIISGTRSRGSWVVARRDDDEQVGIRARRGNPGHERTEEDRALHARHRRRGAACARAERLDSPSRSRQVAPEELDDFLGIRDGSLGLAARVELPGVSRREFIRAPRRDVVMMTPLSAFSAACCPANADHS
jgi:hypothetical protein